jgi:hypothetical protein
MEESVHFVERCLDDEGRNGEFLRGQNWAVPMDRGVRVDEESGDGVFSRAGCEVIGVGLGEGG